MMGKENEKKLQWGQVVLNMDYETSNIGNIGGELQLPSVLRMNKMHRFHVMAIIEMGWLGIQMQYRSILDKEKVIM